MDTAFVNIGTIAKSLLSDMRTESPIELRLLSKLKSFGVDCKTQFKIGPYRVDILVNSKYRKIVVECDGEEFHRDKGKDAKRDEYMQNKGFMVLRFTGSEIHRNVEECAQMVITQISEIYSSRKYQDYLHKYLEKDSHEEKENFDEDINI